MIRHRQCHASYDRTGLLKGVFVGLGKHIERQKAVEGEFQLCDNGAGVKELEDEDLGGLLGHNDCYEVESQPSMPLSDCLRFSDSLDQTLDLLTDGVKFDNLQTYRS